MQVTVQLYAILRERAGRDRVSLELPEGATVAAALDAIRDGGGPLGGALTDLDVVMAVNREYAAGAERLSEGDELALVPPVSGGASAGTGVVASVRVCEEELSLDGLVRAVTVPEAGAVVTFQGVTREVERLEYEAYAEMATERIHRICTEVAGAHDVQRVAAEHRTGAVELGRPSVIVAVSAGHRPAAFAAARELIDRIKSEAPIWKREVEDGAGTWVEGVLPPADRSPGSD